jgi:membrane protein
MKLRAIYEVARDAGVKWWNDKAPRLGAALAFYTALSLSPNLLIVIAVSGLVFGRAAAEGQIEEEIRGLVGSQGAEAIETMVAHAWSPTAGIIAAVIGVITLIIGATGVFAELHDALNTIWGIAPPASRGVWSLLKDRLLSLAMIVSLGFLLLVSLVVNAALAAAATYFTSLLPTNLNVVLQIFNLLVTYVAILMMFALIFKFLPDVRLAWRDVWIGSAITAALFMVGKYLIGLYLGMGTVGSAYGAAGSFVVLLLWLYYSTLIMLFGAELTQIYANRFGSGLAPAPGAHGVHHDTDAKDRPQPPTPHVSGPPRQAAHELQR